MDAIDRKILALLQEDATISIAEISERVHLSETPCWKRIRKLEDTGGRHQTSGCPTLTRQD